MTPWAAIAALDRHLAQHGQDVTLQRLATDDAGVQTIANQAICRAVVGGGDAPQGLAAMPGEAPNTTLILSPSDLLAAGWPGLPAKDDRVLIEGDAKNVETVNGRLIDNQLVRIELQARA